MTICLQDAERASIVARLSALPDRGCVHVEWTGPDPYTLLTLMYATEHAGAFAAKLRAAADAIEATAPAEVAA